MWLYFTLIFLCSLILLVITYFYAVFSVVLIFMFLLTILLYFYFLLDLYWDQNHCWYLMNWISQLFIYIVCCLYYLFLFEVLLELVKLYILFLLIFLDLAYITISLFTNINDWTIYDYNSSMLYMLSVINYYNY